MGLDTSNPTDFLDQITTELLDERDAAMRDRDAADARVKGCNLRLAQLMTLAAAERHQHTDGSVIAWTRPSARETVIPEKLLASGVAPHIIKDCTKVSPVTPYIRVDRPKAPEEATRVAEKIADREWAKPRDYEMPGDPSTAPTPDPKVN
jgi:hypothetical protein